jgi:hypothetical protein
MSAVVFYTNEGFYEAESSSYLVARIIENEAGYDIWERYPTIEEARARCAVLNEKVGADQDNVLSVVASSMRMGRVEREPVSDDQPCPCGRSHTRGEHGYTGD